MKKKHQILPFIDSPSFNSGRTIVTKEALQQVSHGSLILALKRHVRGDWGDINPCEWKSNDRALSGRSELLSVYQDEKRVRFCVSTRGDRSTTTIFLPDQQFRSRGRKG